MTTTTAALKRLFWDTASAPDLAEAKEKNAQIGEQVFVEGVPVYQDGSGAPVEQISPLGYHVGWFGILFLNVSQMVGTGVFSTPGSILRALDSVGLSILYWVIGSIIAFSALAVYLEYASMFPNRSGGQVAYLEQAYPRPVFLFPTAYAFFIVAFSFSSSNAVVLARYIYRAAGYQAGDWANKGLAIAANSLLSLLCLISTRWSIRLMNLISAVKLIILVFIAITGFAVLGGRTRVKDPQANFRNSFDGITDNANGIVNALVNINFAYTGYSNAFNVVAEIKNPFQMVKKVAPISVLIVSILYILANVAYFAAVPAEEIRESKELAAALFFEAVFGRAGKALPALVAVSAAGNIMAVIIGDSRMIRECARQGIVPWPHVWASTRPLGTPFAPILLKWALTTIVILALPFGDAFNFLVDLRSYPDSIFLFLMIVGIYYIRYRRKKEGIPEAPFQVWHVALIFSALVCLFLLIMPWYPPEDGGDVSFWYATYCAVGIALILSMVAYYYVWIKLLPRLKKYQIRTETLVSDEDGSVTHRLLKVPNADVEEWDRTHDDAGNVLMDAVASTGIESRNAHLLKRVKVKNVGPMEVENEKQ
ncbi:amino acid transporter [Polyplosphaeria fusca]|uniref:Amino acid transporter n=1 Tax=Polyplosphaeria fusca TaxID=682080 RepID=A0A9P4QUS0_9PLEO|nr:amino acid transporter [Polyplosphaeria fusca]